MTLSKNFFFIFFILALLSFATTNCGGSATETSQDASFSTFLDEDNDGLIANCDEDDSDPDNMTIIAECDEDLDGYVDLTCAFDGDSDDLMDRDLNEDGLITGDERDISCDVCVGTYDPEQLDSNNDGFGDACDAATEEIVEETTTEETTETPRFQLDITKVKPGMLREVNEDIQDDIKDRMKEIFIEGIIE